MESGSTLCGSREGHERVLAIAEEDVMRHMRVLVGRRSWMVALGAVCGLAAPHVAGSPLPPPAQAQAATEDLDATIKKAERLALVVETHATAFRKPGEAIEKSALRPLATAASLGCLRITPSMGPTTASEKPKEAPRPTQTILLGLSSL